MNPDIEITCSDRGRSKFRIDVIPRLTELLLNKRHSNVIWKRWNLQDHGEKHSAMAAKSWAFK